MVRDRKIRTALRTNQIAEFVTVTAWKKTREVNMEYVPYIAWFKQHGWYKFAFLQCFWFEILAIQDDAVQESVKRAMKLDLKVFKELKRLADVWLSVSKFVLDNHRFYQSKETRPESRSSFGIGRNEYRRLLKRVFSTVSVCKKTSSFHRNCPVYTV